VGNVEGGVEARSESSEKNGLGSCQTHHVGIGPQEDRRCTAGTMGEGEGREEEGCFGGEGACC
jgi:hypothetical protein